MAEKSFRRLTREFLLMVLLHSLEGASGVVPKFNVSDFEEVTDTELDVYIDLFQDTLRTLGGGKRK